MKHLRGVMVVTGLLLVAGLVEAAQAQPPALPAQPRAEQPPTVAPQASPGFAPFPTERNAQETRERLNAIFRQYPPSVREVLRIDPTLMSRTDYIANYPALAAFLGQHPEVVHNPGFFVGERRFEEENSSPAAQAFRTLNNVAENLMVLLIVITLTTGVVWLIRTVVEQVRWQRSTRAQSELHRKLIDRFATSDELLAYLQSPAGRALTETAPMPQAPPARMMTAPLSRIFWSLQSGIVVGSLGIGFIIVSHSIATPEFANALFGVGIIVLAVGLGFGASAAVSYVLSQRLGLVQPVTPHYSSEAPGS